VGNICVFGYALALEWLGPRRPTALLPEALVVVFFAAFTARWELRYIGELLRRWRSKRGHGLREGESGPLAEPHSWTPDFRQ